MRFAPTAPLLFQDELVPDGTRLAGLSALVCALEIKAPVRATCCVSQKYIRGGTKNEGTWKIFDKRYWPGESFGGHLTFALKHENMDLLVLKRVFDVVSRREIETFVQSSPTGAPSRRAWFLYETLTGNQLKIFQVPLFAAPAVFPESTSEAVLRTREPGKSLISGTGQGKVSAATLLLRSNMKIWTCSFSSGCSTLSRVGK